jgi:hypothetical protein
VILYSVAIVYDDHFAIFNTVIITVVITITTLLLTVLSVTNNVGDTARRSDGFNASKDDAIDEINENDRRCCDR